ncbi:MAG: MotA/TolQ/ExbB proton channel family protein [Cyanothece sp. SIO2G6]|nr:MotA/TolQ/ExbB proton channel family protein [Cyanothece sp. SIO2G6]
MNVIEVLRNGGPSIWLLVFLFVLLSFLALTTIIERIWFWSKILTREREIVGRVLESARREWEAAREIARRSLDQPIGRFLYAALELHNPEPEIFQLALQASADEELAAMRRGEKILEAVIAISPLLGLLGTVLGLIRSLGSIRLGDLGTTSTEGVTLGISDALGSTAAGLIIAILSLAFYRIFQSLVLSQVKIFRQAGNELELLYRKDWAYQKQQEQAEAVSASASASASESVSVRMGDRPFSPSSMPTSPNSSGSNPPSSNPSGSNPSGSNSPGPTGFSSPFSATPPSTSKSPDSTERDEHNAPDSTAEAPSTDATVSPSPSSPDAEVQS